MQPMGYILFQGFYVGWMRVHLYVRIPSFALEPRKIDTKVMPYDTCGYLHTIYIGMCNEVAFANRWHVYACKLPWVKIHYKKLVTFITNMRNDCLVTHVLNL